MKLHFAVIGNPIEHSRSPQLHRAFAQKAGIDLHYAKILAPLDGFQNSIHDFFAQGGKGLNVTVPFKEQAYQLCDHLSERAKIAKAVNTLWQCDGKLFGDNTDGEGLVQAVQLLGVDLAQANILIIGAGGATRGVIYPLAQAGVKSICIANRTVERAKQLVDDLRPFVPNCSLNFCGLDDLHGDFDVVINATSASLANDSLILPAPLHFRYAYEMAYGKPSHFLQQAEQRGAITADGWSMLVGQAVEAFRIWHGVQLDLRDFL